MGKRTSEPIISTGPKVGITSKGNKVTRPGAEVSGKAGTNIDSHGMTGSVRTDPGLFSTRTRRLSTIPTYGMLIVFLIAISLLSLLITPNLQVSATSKPDLIPHPIQPPQFNMLQASLVITFTPVATAYLPLIRNDPPPTATATPSATPTATTEPPPTATTIPAIPNVQITHIEYNPPGLDSEGEYVDIHNFETGPVLMTNWTLRDEANTVFTFPGFTLNGQASVRIWIRSGVNNQSNLYWGRNSATWNNDGDTAFLRNSTGQQVDICTYAGGGQGIGC